MMTLKQFYKYYEKDIEKSILSALKEDKYTDDITTKTLFKGRDSKITAAELICKEVCLLAGTDIFKKVFSLIYPDTKYKIYYKDGDAVDKGNKILNVYAPITFLLSGERTALNFLQRMSGVATLTNRFFKMLKYKNAKILHTRKTTPNFRLFELAAVKIGGGEFHRLDLSSYVMVKDNHIEALGGIEDTLKIAFSQKLKSKQKHNFEVEVKTLGELQLILDNYSNNVRVVMLDNFKTDEIGKAVKLLKKHNIKIELSGGINLKNFNILQSEGIDYYSIGALTHGYKSIDFSLEFIH